MQRPVGDRVELDVAHQGTLGPAVLHAPPRTGGTASRPSAAPSSRRAGRGRQRRLLLRAVDDCGDKPLTPGRARRPLTGPLARHGLDPNSLDHWSNSACLGKGPVGDGMSRTWARLPPGVPARPGHSGSGEPGQRKAANRQRGAALPPPMPRPMPCRRPRPSSPFSSSPVARRC